MPEIVKTVSQLIESQFPQVYRDEGPQLIAFVKAYFEFLEEDEKSSMKLNRSLFEINDIDDTLNKFVVNYKEKYLADFPFVSATDKRFMIKNIIDYYRSKGSKQALELLMSMLYGEQAEVYYPGQDVLRVSDSEWFRPSYLELSRSTRTKSFVDKQIRGSRSNASAFVEAVVTKRVDGKLIDLVYLSDVRGTFRRGDKISDDGSNRKAPTVLGSLTSIDIELGGRDNVVGDTFDVVANGAKQGKVRVVETQDATGRVDFKLLNGGSGYSVENANGVQYTDVYVSDVVLDVNNPSLDFIRFEKIEQPIETIYALSSSDIVEDANLYDYIVGYQSSSAGGAYVANGIITEIANTYANGDLIAAGTQALGIDIAANNFTEGETVTSGSKEGDVVSFSGQELIISTTDAFVNGETIVGNLSAASANIESSVPGARLKVLVTDQTFANQILIDTSTVQDGEFVDGEIINEESSNKITFENTNRFNLNDPIIQYVEANTNFNIVETFTANGTANTFTHSANLEAADITSVTVTVDSDLRIENTNYVITNDDVQFYANSIPGSGLEVLISATQSTTKIVDSATGQLGSTGRLAVLNTAVFTAGDTIQATGGAVTANLVSIDDGSLVFDSADGMFLQNETVEVQGNSSANSTIQSVVYDVDDVFGTFIEDASVEQGVLGSATTGRIASGGVEVTTQGARGIVQKDGSLAQDEIIVKDLFGAFTAGKKIRGNRTRKVETINTFTVTGASSLRLNGNASSNGNVDTVSNTYVIGTLVGQNTSAIGVSYDGNTKFSATETGDLFINTRRELLITPPKFAVSDKTFNIDVTQTHEQNVLIDTFTTAQRGQQALFGAFVQFPTTSANAVLFEAGGDGTGMWVGLRQDPSNTSNYLLRYRAGDGGVDGDTVGSKTAGAGYAVVEVADASLPQDDNYHHVVWYANPTTGYIELWIDGTSVGTSTASDNTLEGGLWAGSDTGKYGAASNVPTGEPSTAWSADLGSDLLYYANQTANAQSTAGTIVDLNEEPIYGTSLGQSASFDIETLENTDTYTLNTDFPYANNVSGQQYLDIKISGEGSGVGFVDNFTINDGGTSYTAGQGITISNGGFASGQPLVPATATISGVNANGTITQITVTQRGEGYYETPQFTLPSTSGDTANVSINMDFGYGFPKAPDADLGNLIQDALTFEDFTIGNIVSLGSINPGAAYNRDPFVVVHNKYIASYRRGNFYIEVSGVTGSFRQGELLTQTVNNEQFSKGKVISYDVDTGLLAVERTSFEVGFDPNLAITGARSNATASIVTISPIEDQNIMGDNAVVAADVIAANGVATAVEVIDSGYGYIQNGSVSLESEDTPFIITGKSKSTQQGIGEGYWRTTSSHLNSEKKIHDNKYYHEFSYDILSGLALQRYENVIKRVLHVAGTELFGSVVKRSDVPLSITTPSGNTSISVE